MSTATVRIRICSTDTIEAVDVKTPAIGTHRFASLYREAHGTSAEVPDEVHTAPMWAGPDAADAHSKICERMMSDASAVGFVMDHGFVLLAGQGDGCDVWAKYEELDAD